MFFVWLSGELIEFAVVQKHYYFRQKDKDTFN